MAQTGKRKVQESAVQGDGAGRMPGDFTPPYLRGLRDAFAAVRNKLELQYEDYRPIADKLGLPYIAVLLMVEGHGAPVAMEDFDNLNGWLEMNELTREQALGEMAGE